MQYVQGLIKITKPELKAKLTLEQEYTMMLRRRKRIN